MFIQDVYIERADWRVRVYHAVDAIYTEKILKDLSKTGCNSKMLKEAKKNLERGLLNQGLTFSNLNNKETIMVFGITESAEEYGNTFVHETLHLLQDISSRYGIDPYGEEICYIGGEFFRIVFGYAKEMFCDCCRHKVQPNTK